MVMAEEEENALSIEPEFPKSRVKKIMNLDEDVKRVSSEALFLVSKSTELFLQLLAEKSAEVVIEKKRKTVKLEHMRIAVKRNRPISDFLLDSLPMPSETTKSDKPVVVADRPKSVPVGTRRIDQIFRKSEAQARVEAQVEAQVEAEVEAQVEAQIEAEIEAQASEPVPEPMEES
jgi:histone H3/H4